MIAVNAKLVFFIALALSQISCQSLLMNCHEVCAVENKICDPEMKLYQDLRARGGERHCVHAQSQSDKEKIEGFQQSAVAKTNNQVTLTWIALVALPIAALLFLF